MNRLNELEALCKAAAKAPWRQVGVEVLDANHAGVCECKGWVPGNRREYNAEFIAAARTAMPALIAIARAAAGHRAAAIELQNTQLDWPDELLDALRGKLHEFRADLDTALAAFSEGGK